MLLIWLMVFGKSWLQGQDLKPLEQSVRGLPSRTVAEKAKKAVLEVALERAEASRAAGMLTQHSLLARDVQQALAASAPSMCQPACSDDRRVPALRAVPVKRGNPYLDALTLWARAEMAKADPPWARATPQQRVMHGLETRKVGEEIRNWLWLYVNPASPLQGNPEALKRLLRRSHAFVDAICLHADPKATSKAEVYDQFATEAGISGLVEWVTLYPGLLLPSQRSEWHAGLQSAFDYLWPQMKRSDNWNLNIETARMVAMMHLGLFFRRDDVVQHVLRHVHATLARMRPDGGFPYNGDSNPSCNYHAALVGSLAAIYDLSRDPAIARGLAASQWKGPVMGRTDEFWTSPFHKTIRWNFDRGTEWGNQMILTLSRNPYANFLRGGKGRPDRDSIAWYRDDLPVKPLPDGYTIPDRNVSGPRAWYGRFNYAATLHRKSTGEQITGGHETLMGAMTVDDPDGRVNSILVNVTPCVRVAEADERDAKGVKSSAWARLAASLQGTYLTGKHYSTSAASYSLTTMRGSAYQGKVTDWRGRQVWLGLPDRIIGLLSLVPTRPNAEAYEIQTVLRLISGGSAGAAVCKKLQRLGERHYRYGELEIRLHQTNFPSTDSQIVPYRRTQFPASELRLHHGTSTPGKPLRVAAGEHYDCVVEVRPCWAKGDATVHAAIDGSVLQLQAMVGRKRWQIWFNDSLQPVTVILPRPTPNQAAACLRVTNLKSGLPQSVQQAKIQLEPNQHAVWLQSPDAVDFQPGWESFQAMVSAVPTR